MSTLFSATVNGVATNLNETQVVATLQPFGFVGPQGPPGNTGAQGPQGAQGAAGTDSLFTAAAAEFTVSSGTISLTREGKISAKSSNATIGDAEVMVLATGTITLTLTTDTGCTHIAVSNVGVGTITIAAGSGQSINGGQISLAAPASSTAPSAVELWRDPSNNSWWIAWATA